MCYMYVQNIMILYKKDHSITFNSVLNIVLNCSFLELVYEDHILYYYMYLCIVHYDIVYEDYSIAFISLLNIVSILVYEDHSITFISSLNMLSVLRFSFDFLQSNDNQSILNVIRNVFHFILTDPSSLHDRVVQSLCK